MGQSTWRAVGVATSLGVTLALLTAGGVLGGRWLDGRMHTAPLFTIIGLVVGLGIGFTVFVREVVRVLGSGPKQ